MGVRPHRRSATPRARRDGGVQARGRGRRSARQGACTSPKTCEDGAFYRFTPRRWPDLDDGLLEFAKVAGDGAGEWVRVPDPLGPESSTRRQVPSATEFTRAEGIWFDSDTVYVATTYDSKIHAYDTAAGTHRGDLRRAGVQGGAAGAGGHVTGSRDGELFICEDIGSAEINLGVMTRDREVGQFLTVSGKTT